MFTIVFLFFFLKGPAKTRGQQEPVDRLARRDRQPQRARSPRCFTECAQGPARDDRRSRQPAHFARGRQHVPVSPLAISFELFFCRIKALPATISKLNEKFICVILRRNPLGTNLETLAPLWGCASLVELVNRFCTPTSAHSCVKPRICAQPTSDSFPRTSTSSRRSRSSVLLATI